MGPLTKAAIGAGVLAVVVVLFVLLRESDSGVDSSSTTVATTQTAVVDDERPSDTDAPANEPADEPRPGGENEDIPIIRVEADGPVGGVQELEFTSGERIRFKVVSDIADEVHFHGYDLSQEVEAGGSTTFDVQATIEGLFEVELEEALIPIADITVSPG